MGMLSTKDHREVFEALLRPGDSLHLVPVPGHLSATPADLGAIAQAVCPELVECRAYLSLAEGLQAISIVSASLKVLCGSLYLIGDFFANQQFVATMP
jgi:dihydrofolate synthase/folylpolyglutamate synthase